MKTELVTRALILGCILCFPMTGCATNTPKNPTVTAQESVKQPKADLAKASTKPVNTGSAEGDWRNEVVLRALSLLGVNYRFGGNTAEDGLDCSGFVRLVVKDALGLILPRRSEEISYASREIVSDDLKPGDLVFFNTLKKTFSHVGIYIGNNQFIHSPSSGNSVRVDTLDKQYWNSRFNGARRISDQPSSLIYPAGGLTGLIQQATQPSSLQPSALQPLVSPQAAPAAAPKSGQYKDN